MTTIAIAWLFTAALAADPVREVHGAGDAFAAPGVALAWGIERGASEAATTVVVRVAVDTKLYPWMAVVGIDPFSKAERVRQQATLVPNMLDVRIPRAQVGDFPNTAFRLYASEAAARANAPALVVYYHGIPDTAPEFTSDVRLDAHLLDRIARLRAPPPKPP